MTSNGEGEAGPSKTGRNPGSQKAIGAGLTLAVSVGLFACAGLWLDRQLGTKPWLLLLLVFLGIVGGILHLIREVAPEMWPFGAPAQRGEPGPRTDSESPKTPTSIDRDQPAAKG